MIKLSAFSDEAGASLCEQIDALHRNGIAMTEPRSIDGKNVSDLTQMEAKEISATLKHEGISLSALGSPMGKVPVSIDFEKYLDSVRHMCEIAAILGTDKIRMFSFYDAHNERTRVIEYLSRMVEVAASYGIALCHENEKGIYGDTVSRILDLHESVKGLRLVYDPANFLQVGELPSVTVPALLGKVEYLHIKDFIMAAGEHVPAGKGDGEITRLIDLLDRDTVLTLEPHLMLFAGYAAIDSEPMRHRFLFENSACAFDAAAAALKSILISCGYTEIAEGYVKK